MRFHIIAIGKAKAGSLRDAYREYAGRLVFPVTLKEHDASRLSTAEARKKAEAEWLLAAVPKGARRIVLDERGKTISSEDFAQKLRCWQDDGVRDFAFIIGGPDGLDDSVRQGADLVVSFGAMTWPHMLVRAMLAEQLYRAQQILAGHPYHRA